MTTDAEILRSLRQSPTNWVSGAELSQRLGISRAAIWARIEELRSLGYEFEAVPHRGYRLLSVPDVLHGDDLVSRLPPNTVVGRDIRVFQETSSTNDVVEKLARDGVREGVVVFAESQSKGRGRLGRSWTSTKGSGLWFSVLLRPAFQPQAATRLTIAAATALSRAIRSQTHLNPEIKWPNDILLGGMKVVGILTELSTELDRIHHAVVGVGVNVNQVSQDFPPSLAGLATSLRLASGQMVNRADLAAAILLELEADYRRICHGHFMAVAEEWLRQCVTLGQQVCLQVGGRRLLGRAEALDADGALLLRTQHGHLERVVGGDVTIEKPQRRPEF